MFSCVPRACLSTERAVQIPQVGRALHDHVFFSLQFRETLDNKLLSLWRDKPEKSIFVRRTYFQ